MPARGNEKPDAEGTVKAVQRRFATPVPRVADRDELNLFFRKCCEAERERTVQSLLGPFLIKTRLAEDLAAATPCPASVRPLRDRSRGRSGQVPDRRLRLQSLSVPRPFAHRMVTVKGYVDRVVLIAEGRAVATHARSYQKQTLVLDPVHYLATLGRRPARWTMRRVPRLALPACFTDFRAALETPRRDGRRTTVRAGIATPGRASPDPRAQSNRRMYQRASDKRRGRHPADASFATIEATTRTASPPQLEMPGAAQVQVPLPDLNCYDQFLGARKTINHLQMR